MDCFVITELAIYPFSLRIQSLVKEKKGFLLHATTEKKSAWAEVSPLPGFSRESIDEAEKELHFLVRKLPFSIKEISQKYSFCPSVDFALDSLNYTLFSSPSDLPTYPLCAFLSASFEEMKKQIPIIISQGYEHVKVKISHLSSREAHEIFDLLIGKVKLKIDLNRAWPLPAVLSFFQNYTQETFEYVEEPVQTLEELSFFPYPFALDETLRENAVLPELPFLRALIIKPMLMGGADAINKALHAFTNIKPQIILSSSHESGVGLFHLCHLQQRCQIPMHPLGVDPYRFIEKDVLVNPHTIAHGKLTLSALEIIHDKKLCLT